jgi:hypothetical protein
MAGLAMCTGMRVSSKAILALFMARGDRFKFEMHPSEGIMS